jgi:hypothetical protein
MKNKLLLTLAITSLSIGLSAQEYAKNSFGIHTAGPIQSFGLQWNHQFSPSTGLTTFYGAAVEASYDATEPYTFEGSSQGYTGTGFETSTWTGFLLNHRPLEDFQGFRVVGGGGVGRLGGSFTGIDDGYNYFVNGHGPFAYMGIGLGSKPVKGFQWGIDIGWLRAPGFDVISDGVDAVAAAHAMELAKQNHTAPFFPNAQISVSWGI